jgi:pimeloyl-ACP methyl ester carboxylesterase
MTALSNRNVSRFLRSFALACALPVLALQSACGTSETPTVAHVSSRAVEVVESGAGNVTVVFESGLGADWSPWDKVATEVAVGARVFAYSRPGYGKSEPSPDPRDGASIVEDLRTLLADRGVTPPYVLVGHSFGGTYMELFAKSHPEEVVGVVLVEPRHRDFTAACDKAGLKGCSIPASAVDSLPPEQKAEVKGFASISDEIKAAGGFGPYPVRVLTGTSHQGFSPEVEALWESMLGSLAHEAADGKQSIFTGAGHYLQLEQPHEVAQVILSLVPASGK